MALTTVREKYGLEPPKDMPPKEIEADILPVVEIQFAALRVSIENDTLTVKQIDAFLHENTEAMLSQQGQAVHEFLLSKKAFLLFNNGQQEEGLSEYDRALSVDQTPSTWALKGSALLQLDRLDDAFDAFRHSYSLKHKFGPQKQAYLVDLLGTWSIAALLRGLSGILEQDIREAQIGVFEYIELLREATGDNLEHLVLQIAVEDTVSEQLQVALQELALMVRLLSITDPFEGWRELTKEMHKVWPEGLSAVDAVREERDREWSQ
jgi:tetratricopeptide (TPR) repeat protein